MGEYKIYGWHTEVTRHRDEFLLGANFNTNNYWDERESYVCIYLGKWT